MDLLCHDLIERIVCDFSFPELVTLSHASHHLRYTIQHIIHCRIYYRLYKIFGHDAHVRLIFNAMNTLRIVLAGTFPLHVLDYMRFKDKTLLLTLVTPKDSYNAVVRMLQQTTYCHSTAQNISSTERKSIRQYAVLTTTQMEMKRNRVC